MKAVWAPWRMEYLLGEEKPGHCIFCEAGRTSPWVVYVAEHAQVVVNRFPYANGHAMVAPLRHISEYRELDPEEFAQIGDLTARVIDVLKVMMTPDGFNIGYNVGAAAGAGIADHLHQHVVPRWQGDTNFMPVLADTRVIPEHLEATAAKFKQLFVEAL